MPTAALCARAEALNDDVVGKRVLWVCAPEDLDNFEVFFIRFHEATSHGNYNCTTGNNSRLYDSEYEEWLHNKDQQLYKKVNDYTHDEQCSFSQMLNVATPY